jgi:hypothetical protein
MRQKVMRIEQDSFAIHPNERKSAMQRLIVLLMLGALVLSACATPATPVPGAPTPQVNNPIATPDPAQPPSNSAVIVPTLQEVGLAATLSLGEPVTLVPIGIVSFPEATEPVDPNALPPDFQRLTLTRTLGMEGAQTVVELSADGTLTRDGVVSALPASEVAAVRAGLNALRIYDFDANFTGPVVADNGYRYYLWIIRTDGGDRTVPAIEAYMPQEYVRLFNALAELGLVPFPAF